MLHTALLMLGVGIFAGIMGSILGIGGGMIVTPIVTLAMGLDIKYAIGASIIAVIATSSGSTIAFLKDDVLNLRVAMFLEIATTIGAIIGALLTGAFEPMILYISFGSSEQSFSIGELLSKKIKFLVQFHNPVFHFVILSAFTP